MSSSLINLLTRKKVGGKKEKEKKSFSCAIEKHTAKMDTCLLHGPYAMCILSLPCAASMHTTMRDTCLSRVPYVVCIRALPCGMVEHTAKTNT